MTVTLGQHVEELRAEHNACLDPAEREVIWNELCQAHAALAAAEADQPASAPS